MGISRSSLYHPQPALPPGLAEGLVELRDLLLHRPPQALRQLLVDRLHVLGDVAVDVGDDVLLDFVRLPQQEVHVLVVVDADDVGDRLLPLVLVLQLQLEVLQLLEPQVDVALDLVEVGHQVELVLEELTPLELLEVLHLLVHYPIEGAL